jgi:hypothetical protein
MGKSNRDLSTVTRVGLDLAKRVFQVHAVDAKGRDRCGAQTHAQPAGPVLRRDAAVRGGDGGVLFGASLGRDADRIRARGSIAAARACEAVY